MLESFLFRRDLGVSLDHDALSKKFFLSARAADFLKCGLSFIDKVCTEGTKADLDKGTVKENLSADWEIGNCLLKM